MISAKRIAVIGGLLVIVIFGWYNGLHRFADLDRCIDSGGRWVGGWNECECPAGGLPEPERSWCLPTLTAEIQNADGVLRGRCIALERGFDTSSGIETGRMTIEVAAIISGPEGRAGDLIKVRYEGGQDNRKFCSGSDVIAMYGAVPSERVFQHSYTNLFLVFEDAQTGAEYVAVTYDHGFTLYDAASGQPYSTSWDRVPYRDFIYSIEKTLTTVASKGS